MKWIASLAGGHLKPPINTPSGSIENRFPCVLACFKTAFVPKSVCAKSKIKCQQACRVNGLFSFGAKNNHFFSLLFSALLLVSFKIQFVQFRLKHRRLNSHGPFFFLLDRIVSECKSLFFFSFFLYLYSLSLCLVLSPVLEHKVEQTSHFAGLSSRYKIWYMTTLPFNSTANSMCVFFLQLWLGERVVGHFSFFFCLKSKIVASLTRQLWLVYFVLPYRA